MASIQTLATALRLYEFKRGLAPPVTPSDDELLAALAKLTPAEQQVLAYGSIERGDRLMAKLRAQILDTRQRNMQTTGEVIEMNNANPMNNVNPKYRIAELLKERQAINTEIERLKKMAEDRSMVAEVYDYLDSQGLVAEFGGDRPRARDGWARGRNLAF